MAGLPFMARAPVRLRDGHLCAGLCRQGRRAVPRDAVETLADGCHLEGDGGAARRGVTIVAHSLGAWAVRVALRMHPHLADRRWVRNVVTLASPLGGVPYAADAGGHGPARRLHGDGDTGGDGVAWILLSGGLRDEVIPPAACAAPPTGADDPAAGGVSIGSHGRRCHQ